MSASVKMRESKMKLALAILIGLSVTACALDKDAFRDDRSFQTKQLFEKLERQSGGTAS